MKKLSLLTAVLCGMLGLSRGLAVTVTNLDDAGPGSLRAAIAEGGTIDFAVTGTITLTSGELVIEAPVTINGPGPNALRIQRSTAEETPEFRILRISSGTVAAINGVTISNGLIGPTYDNGAGILNEGSLTLSECVISGNRSTGEYSRGTGLFNANDARLTASRCSFIENTGAGSSSEGGGIYVFGNVTVTDSTFRGNSVHGRGAGLHVDYFGSARIDRCTFSGNVVEGPNAQGGGIYNYGSLVLINSTLSGNVSSDSGGGIHVDALSRGTTIRSCTISGNNAGSGSGIYANGFAGTAPAITLKNSIVAGNSASDIQNSSVITSLGHDLFGTIEGNGIPPAAGDQFGITAAALRIGPLASNGGPTQTRALLGGSPAIDHGSESEFPPTDQRGVTRPFGPRIDIGAYELNEVLSNQPPIVRIVTPTNNASFTAPANITVCANAEDSDGFVLTVEFFAGTNSLGIRTNCLPCASPINPFCLLWSNVPPGNYVLTAKATDDKGETSSSEAIHVAVTSGQDLPVVTVRATDSEASEPGINTGRFRLTRDGNTNNALNVYCQFSGSASNGLDYSELGRWVNIPAGVRTANVTVKPIDDALDEERETVVLALVPPPFDPPTTYNIGSPGSATVYVYDNDPAPTNVPPSVRILTPTNGQMFVAPANITVCADARDTNGYIYSVEFFAGDHKIGARTNCFVCTDPQNPFCILWSNVPPGNYALRAKATDNKGAMTWSEPVNIAVKSSEPTNHPPVVNFHSPSSNQVFHASTDIPLTAYAHDAEDGFDLKVEFFRGDQSLGLGTFVPTLCPSPYCPYFTLVWSNVPPGEYNLTAKVTDKAGAMTISPPVHIVVRNEIILPALVTIEATDSHATEPSSAGVIDSGVFTIRRDRGTNIPLQVFYSIGGGASNGVDYARISNSVVIPAGSFSTRVVINPLHDNLPETAETVVLRLEDMACVAIYPPPPECYRVGTPREAVVFIQDNDDLPAVITIEATQPRTSEPALNTDVAPGVFTIYRSGGTNIPLEVHYTIRGTASNGVDYARISNAVVIPVGEFSTRINITALHDNLPETSETVVLRLEYPPCFAIYPPPPECYGVGTPREAVVFIEDNDHENARPKVVITTPHNGAAFTAPANIAIVTDTVDADGYVPRVEFFVGDRKIGEDSKEFFVAPTNGSHISYEMVWSNVPPGLYSLSAKATDNQGAMGWSEPVRITVMGTNEPPHTNLPPVVAITAIDPLAIEGGHCEWRTNADGIATRECRTNTATFLVRRSGPTNAPLTVAYSIRGPASNGVDYLELPNTLTIPAGERSKRIVVTAIDDTTAECAETVILKLLPPETDPRPYVIGWPSKAAAVILDNDRPAPGTCVLCDGTFHLCIPAANGLTYRLETSIDLIHWLPIYTTTVTESGVLFPDAETDEFPQKFYRVVPEPAAAQDEADGTPSTVER